MALETLKAIDVIDSFNVVRKKPENMTWDDFDILREEYPINITDEKNMISFKIQNGPIKEKGKNGCQIDTIITAAKMMLEGLNKNFPCRENAIAITKLDEALLWLDKRRKDREARNVEGTNQI